MKEHIVPDRFDEIEEEREIDRDIREMELEPLPKKGVVFKNWWHGVGSPDKHYWWKDIK